MNGVAYEVEMQAKATGVDATSDQVLALADSIDATSKVCTNFDTAIAAAQAQLAQASLAAASAAAALQGAESKFAALEREATKAAKAVERAALKGGDTSALQSQAAAAAAAVGQQAMAVDKARAAATAAAAAETKLAGSLRTLEGAAKRAAVAQETAGKAGKSSAAGFRESLMATQGLMASTSPMIGRLGQLVQGIGSIGLAGVVIMAAVAVVALGAAFIGGAIAAMKFAIANDKVASKRLDEISKKAKENIKGLFSGIDTKPLLNALDRMASMFGSNTAAGHALKTLIETIMNPLIRAIEWLMPYAHELWNGMVYGALQVAIAVVSLRNAILRAIPASVKTAVRELIAKLDGLGLAFSIGKVIMYAVAAVLGVIGIALLAVGAAIGVAVATVYIIIDAFVGLWNGIMQLGPAISAVGDWFAELPGRVIGAIGELVSGALSALSGLAGEAMAAGAAFVQGLVDAIKSGVGAVADAAKSLAMAPVNAVKSVLKIKSPSGVMRIMGGYTAEGMAEGVEEGTPAVRSSIEDMVGLADVEAEGPTMRGDRSSTTTSTTTATTRGGNTYHVTINAPSGDAEDIRETFEAWLEGEAIAAGAA